MKSAEIEIIEEAVHVLKKQEIALPANFVSVGEVSRDALQVYIKQDVYKWIEKYAKENMEKEVGSILIGYQTEENGRNTLVISDYIEAKYTDATASTLTFTHETWDYVYKEKEKKYPEKLIVGWQHTHPGYGIFLSNYDLFIQDNFFNLPWQTAYVVDPIANTRGFFEWKDGKTAKMSGFYVYDDIGKEIKISEKSKPAKKSISVSGIVLSVLLFVSVLISTFLGIENNKLARRADNSEKVAVIDEITVESEEEADVNTETFIVYTVEKGDGLEAICEKLGVDYLNNLQKIKQINGINNVNRIYTGQTLYLPKD